MQREFGNQFFAKEIHYYFRNKQICLIFNDFDLLLQPNVKYYDHIFSSINECKVPYLAITNDELKIPIQNKIGL
jgi:hypothetical protein